MSSSADRPISCTYLIASHTQPEGVARLARSLTEHSPTARVFVHHDAKAETLAPGLFLGAGNVTIASRPIVAHWGTFSLVELALRSLREIRQLGDGFDWVIMLSGQHYPARALTDFEAMLKGSGADAIMTLRPVAPSDRHLNDRYGFRYRRILDGQLPRVLRAKQLYDTVFNSMQPFVRVQTDRRGSFVGWRNPNSVFALGVPVYTGSQWWAISRAAVDAVLDVVDKADLVERYSGTLIPDESFFQTVIANSPGLTISNTALHYEHFPTNYSSPRFLTIEDLDAIRSSQRWFTRKIDSANDGGLRDALDAVRNNGSAFQPAIS